MKPARNPMKSKSGEGCCWRQCNHGYTVVNTFLVSNWLQTLVLFLGIVQIYGILVDFSYLTGKFYYKGIRVELSWAYYPVSTYSLQKGGRLRVRVKHTSWLTHPDQESETEIREVSVKILSHPALWSSCRLNGRQMKLSVRQIFLWWQRTEKHRGCQRIRTAAVWCMTKQVVILCSE